MPIAPEPLPNRTMDRTLAPPRGILRAPRADGLLEARRFVPSEALAPFVHHYWWIRWSLRSPFVGEALPHPAAQIRWTRAHGNTRAVVQGVTSGALARTLSGNGETFGVSFRPAMGHALLGAAACALHDARKEPSLQSVLGPSAPTWEASLTEVTPAEKVERTEAWLAPLLGKPSAHLSHLRDLVERIAADSTMVRVTDVVAASGREMRSLQRTFRLHIGLSPKAVLRRYRLHEAAERLREEVPPSLVELAASLGYADQAHFTRDFKRTVGRTPGDFARGSHRRNG